MTSLLELLLVRVKIDLQDIFLPPSHVLVPRPNISPNAFRIDDATTIPDASEQWHAIMS